MAPSKHPAGWGSLSLSTLPGTRLSEASSSSSGAAGAVGRGPKPLLVLAAKSSGKGDSASFPRDGRSSKGPAGKGHASHVPWETWRKQFVAGFGIGAGGMFYFGGGGPKCIAHAKFPLNTPAPKPAKEKGPKKVLIMMSKTGGGHKASAEAIQAGFSSKFGREFKVDIVDLWMDHCPFPVNQMPKTYNTLVKNPWMWRVQYLSTQPRLIHLPYLKLIRILSQREIGQCMETFDPDLLVSVHPLLQHVPIQVMQQRIRDGLMDPISFATVVTDFTTCHNAWFHKAASQCFVPTEETVRRAKRMGLSDDQITMHGLPIRPGFDQSGRKQALRKKLGMSAAGKAVLLVGGGEGMGKIEATMKALASVADPANPMQIVVICGNNKKLVAKLSAADYPDGLEVTVNGFVTNMNEWMCACDAIITKAGPGTMAEALIAGLPILLNGNVPCQEEGNIPYVIENGVGAFEKRPKEIADIIKRWFSPGFAPELAAMCARARALGRPDALYKIVEDLAELCRNTVLAPAMAERLGTAALVPAA